MHHVSAASRSLRTGTTFCYNRWSISTWHMKLLSEPTSYTNIYILQPDEASSSCDSPKCRSSFNLFVRKHHCRHCGHIFCAEHIAYTIPLDQNAKFHPEGMQSRACDSCYKQYRSEEHTS